MIYNVKFSKLAIKELNKLDYKTKALIFGWIEKNLDKIENPYIHGKPLVGNKKGQWRYRVGDYRIITEIVDSELIIYVIEIGHRREIYD